MITASIIKELIRKMSRDPEIARDFALAIIYLVRSQSFLKN